MRLIDDREKSLGILIAYVFSSHRGGEDGSVWVLEFSMGAAITKAQYIVISSK
jgi:hypothetical protein